ncbi:MAG: hypothetical protein JOZ50_09835, partial [Candidatus Eremiobacteraeota bacterium]|nr:hypothetical protein [Candidatus Eremiobacteraeota bacterium]
MSPWLYEARADLKLLQEPLAVCPATRFGFQLRRGKKSLWALVGNPDGARLACRVAYAPGHLRINDIAGEHKGTRIDLETDYGSLRVFVAFEPGREPLLRWTTKLLPTQDLQLPYWPRDVYVCGRQTDPLQSKGTVHTNQRGLRTGIVFASVDEPETFSFLYWQNFSALCRYFDATRTSPADTVGGVWPELGYAAPSSKVPLPKSREETIADAYVALTPQRYENDRQIAASYLDLFARVYQSMPHPEVVYHHWPDKAQEALRDMAFSPQCTYERRGRRYAMPYVGDATKPPESMVHFTVLHPAREYAAWGGIDPHLVRELVKSVDSFFDPKIGAMVRWLPGEKFKKSSEDGQRHANMDSWYFYHTLFNLSRLAKEGHSEARRRFAASLPLAMRIAKRFDYRWPVFFNIRTLEIVRAESAPGKGGEDDVAGLYALVMLQAYELFRRREYRAEAERAAAALSGLGFSLGYQMNTTGFAAEAMLRLWKITGRQYYLEMSYVCLANLVDNMWVWECDYGWGKAYRTFFGLFPLR